MDLASWSTIIFCTFQPIGKTNDLSQNVRGVDDGALWRAGALVQRVRDKRAVCSSACKQAHVFKRTKLLKRSFPALVYCLGIPFYRTRVRSLAVLVSDSLTHSLTDSLLFSKLDWSDPEMWIWQLKTCWGFYCCWCWCWGSCWQQLVDLGADVWS